MDRKYQIFISSTQRDLRAEREAAATAILKMGHIPVGMEMFNAADASSWKIITRFIDVSDFYLVIVAHRYGSLDGTVSFTEKEYDYAVSKGIPAFGFVINRTAPWPGDQTDADPLALERLNAFKKKIELKQISYWHNPDSLACEIVACLATQIPLADRPGWVRGDTVPTQNSASRIAELNDEINRLEEENSRLKPLASEEAKFAVIDAMAEPAEVQAVILMYEMDVELPKDSRYVAGYVHHGSSSGNSGSIASLGGGSGRLDSVGITRSGGAGRTLILTPEGKRFAKWLISKNRKATFFWTALGGWGAVPKDSEYHKWAKEAGLQVQISEMVSLTPRLKLETPLE